MHHSLRLPKVLLTRPAFTRILMALLLATPISSSSLNTRIFELIARGRGHDVESLNPRTSSSSR